MLFKLTFCMSECNVEFGSLFTDNETSKGAKVTSVWNMTNFITHNTVYSVVYKSMKSFKQIILSIYQSIFVIYFMGLPLKLIKIH